MMIIFGDDTKLLGSYATQNLEHKTTKGVITWKGTKLA